MTKVPPIWLLDHSNADKQINRSGKTIARFDSAEEYSSFLRNIFEIIFDRRQIALYKGILLDLRVYCVDGPLEETKH
jgi:hypothetical protein